MRIRKLLIVVLGLTFSSYVFGQFPGDGFKQAVVGTDHDLRGSFTGATAVCEFCHAPHKLSGAGGSVSLLWNVTVKTGPYAVYGGSATFGGAATIRDPATASSTNAAAYMSLCLSCHDGTVTEAAFYNRVGLGSAGSFTAPDVGEQAGVGLANDHPVDFTYSVALASADGGLKSPNEGAGVAIPYVGTTPLPLFKDQGTDVSGRLECATCHNPHNNTNTKFLRMSNTASALCLNCHGS